MSADEQAPDGPPAGPRSGSADGPGSSDGRHAGPRSGSAGLRAVPLTPAEGEPDGSTVSGPDLVRQALAAARAAAAAKQPRVTRKRRSDRPAAERGGDPVAFGAAVQQWVAARGAEADVAVGRVTGAWETLVAEPLASRCRPVSLVDGELVLEAETTAWATQVRLLAPQVVATLAEALGPGVVTRVRVHGPTGPSWSRGPRRVAGRGPRDTYG